MPPLLPEAPAMGKQSSEILFVFPSLSYYPSLLSSDTEGLAHSQTPPPASWLMLWVGACSRLTGQLGLYTVSGGGLEVSGEQGMGSLGPLDLIKLGDP